MKLKTQKRLGLAFIIFIPLLLFLLCPLENPAYKISYDQERMAFRQNFLANPQLKTETDSLPNIIVILADDLGLMDVSKYGSKQVKTEHIDAIGKNGVTFTEAYVTSPVCAPSRAGLMTGRYPQRFGFEINIHERYPKNRLEYFVYANLLNTGDWKVAQHDDWAIPSQEDIQKQGLPSTEFTLPELLKTKGYHTAAFGKWHMGSHRDAIPINRGFDYHYGFYEAFSLYAPVDKEGIINQRLTDFSDPFIWKKGRTGTCAIRKNDEVIQEDHYLTAQIAKEAKEWISVHQDEPFFAYIPFSAPHTPFQAPKSYYDQFAHINSPEKRIYYAMIQALDDAVGNLMQHLRDLNLEENTLVFFLSDNGGAEYTLAADNSPLKGGKFTNFEGGLNVPFMMQWKGRIPAGIMYHKPVSSLDIFATCSEIARLNLPEDRVFDGVNLLPFILDPIYREQMPHEMLYWRSAYHKAIRRGDWKLIQDDLANRTVLYHLATDKYEQKDWTRDKLSIVKNLKEELELWESELMASKWPRVMDYEIREGGEIFYFPL